MKKGAIPKLSKKWWKKNRAMTVKGKALSKALGNYEEKLKEVDRRPTYKGFDELDDLLDAIHAVIPATAEEARTAIMASKTLAAVQKYPQVIEAEKVEIGIMRKGHGEMIVAWEKRMKKSLDGVRENKRDYEQLLLL